MTGPHRHKFITDDARTIRVCKVCDEKQVKVSGRWVKAS